MHNFKKILFHSLIIIIFVFVFLFLFTVPYFYGEKYYYQDYKVRKILEGKIDTLIIGSSHALRSIKPIVLQKELNMSPYNLASPLMSMEGRYVLLNKEINRNNIDTVILELSYNALTLDRKTLGFEGDLYVLGRLDNVSERLSFFTNAFDISEYKKVISDTIKRSVHSIFNKKTDIIQYETKGYLPVESTDLSLTNSEMNAILNTETFDSTIKEDNLKFFNEIVNLCKKNNIRVIIVVTPVSDQMILRYNNSDEVFNQYKELAKKNELEYYDFNLDKMRKKLYDSKSSYYDETHMSDSGADIFSKRLAEVLNMVNNKKDISNAFYQTYTEQQKNILK